jgi:molecular chaperone GrpE
MKLIESYFNSDKTDIINDYNSSFFNSQENGLIIAFLACQLNGFKLDDLTIREPDGVDTRYEEKTYRMEKLLSPEQLVIDCEHMKVDKAHASGWCLEKRISIICYFDEKMIRFGCPTELKEQIQPLVDELEQKIRSFFENREGHDEMKPNDLPEKEEGLDETPPAPAEKVEEPEPESEPGVILEKLAELSRAVAALQECFDDKIMEDAHKNEMFDKLHRELNSYQNGLIDKIVNTMAMDIIQLVDNTKKNIDLYEKKEPTEESYKKLLGCIKGIAEDLQDILYRQSIESYSVPGEEVDVKRQKIIQTIDTDDKSKDNLLAVRTAEGYEKDGKVVRPERIKIFKYKPDTKQPD